VAGLKVLSESNLITARVTKEPAMSLLGYNSCVWAMKACKQWLAWL
jgi:hypothetical protein